MESLFSVTPGTQARLSFQSNLPPYTSKLMDPCVAKAPSDCSSLCLFNPISVYPDMIHTPLWLHTSVDVCACWATNLSHVLLGSAALLPSHLSPSIQSARSAGSETCAGNQCTYFTSLNSEAAGETSLRRVNNITEISTLSGHRHIPCAQIHTHAHWLYLNSKWAQVIVLNDSLSTQTTMAANKKNIIQ